MISFRENVYKAVKKIPKGKTKTYKEIAVVAGRPKAWRAVGNILNKNFNPEIPCHRVICSDGRVGGYNRGRKEKQHKRQHHSNLHRFPNSNTYHIFTLS